MFLDGERHPVQGPQRVTPSYRILGLLGLAESPRRVQGSKRLQRAIEFLYPAQEMLGHLHGRHVALGDTVPNLPSRHPRQLPCPGTF